MCDAFTMLALGLATASTVATVKSGFAQEHNAKAAAKDAKKTAAAAKTVQDLTTLQERRADYASRRVGQTQTGSAAALFSPRSFFTGA